MAAKKKKRTGARKKGASKAASARGASKKSRKSLGRKGKKTKAKSASGKSKVKKAGKKSTARAARTSGKSAGGRTASPKKQKTVGEGDYAASRSFLKDQAGFVARNRSDIPAMGKDAEKALEGPEGDSLRDAEATAAARSRDTF